MKNLFPVLAFLVLMLGGAFAVAVGVVMLTSGSCSPTGRQVGIVLIYEVDPQLEDPGRPADMQKLAAAIDRRLNTRRYPIARIRQLDGGQHDKGRIEIGVLGDDPKTANSIERLLSHVGTLEFRILANLQDHKPLIERARNEDGQTVADATGYALAWWVPVHDESALEGREYPGIVPGDEITKRTRKQGRRTVTEVLVVKDRLDVTGAYLEQAAGERDAFGQPCVGFVLNPEGGRRFGALTKDNLPDALQNLARRLGIIVDGRLYSAPAIQIPVFNKGIITGSFTKEEVADLVDVLNTGALPVAIKQVDRRTVDTGQ